MNNSNSLKDIYVKSFKVVDKQLSGPTPAKGNKAAGSATGKGQSKSK
jgi:hypothetical protein